MALRRRRRKVPIDAFCLSLRAEGKARTTVKWSRKRLGQFERWLAAEGLHFNRLKLEHLEAYVVSLCERQLSKHTIYGYKKLLRQFFNWCVNRRRLRRSPAAGWQVKQPRPPDPESKSVRLEDVLKLLEACRRSWPPRDVRDEALVGLLFSTGMRAGEVVELRLRDVKWRRDQCIVRIREAKGDKFRPAYPGPADARALRRWLDVRPHSQDSHVFLCFDDRHQDMGWHKFTYWGLHQVFRRLGKRAGVRVSAHGFRHGFAIQYLDAGGNLAELSDLLGHSDVSVTKRYYGSYEGDRLARAAARYSPGKALEERLEEESLRQLWLPAVGNSHG